MNYDDTLNTTQIADLKRVTGGKKVYKTGGRGGARGERGGYKDAYQLHTLTLASTHTHTRTKREGEQSASLHDTLLHSCAQFDREPTASPELRAVTKVRVREPRAWITLTDH